MDAMVAFTILSRQASHLLEEPTLSNVLLPLPPACAEDPIFAVWGYSLVSYYLSKVLVSLISYFWRLPRRDWPCYRNPNVSALTSLLIVAVYYHRLRVCCCKCKVFVCAAMPPPWWQLRNLGINFDMALRLLFWNLVEFASKYRSHDFTENIGHLSAPTSIKFTTCTEALEQRTQNCFPILWRISKSHLKPQLFRIMESMIHRVEPLHELWNRVTIE